MRLRTSVDGDGAAQSIYDTACSINGSGENSQSSAIDTFYIIESIWQQKSNNYNIIFINFYIIGTMVF